MRRLMRHWSTTRNILTVRAQVRPAGKAAQAKDEALQSLRGGQVRLPLSCKGVDLGCVQSPRFQPQ